LRYRFGSIFAFIKVRDEKQNLLLSLKDYEGLMIHFTFLAKGIFTYRFSNKQKLSKHIYTAFNCNLCRDQGQNKLMEKKDLDKKIERLVNLQVMLGVTSANTQRMFEQTARTREFMSHKHQNYLEIESRMKIFGWIEVLAIFLLSLWQIYYFKRLVLKRRFF